MWKKILVPLDGSPLAESVLPYVEDLAHQPGAEVTLLRVSPPAQYVVGEAGYVIYLDEQMENIRTSLKEYLEGVAQGLRSKGLTAHTGVEFGEPAEEIARYAQEHGFDFIAMSTHGRTGLSRLIFGSVAQEVLRRATVPVLLFRGEEGPRRPD